MIGLIIVMIVAIALVARLVNKYQRERVPEHSKEVLLAPVTPTENLQAAAEDPSKNLPTTSTPHIKHITGRNNRACSNAAPAAKMDLKPEASSEVKSAAKLESKTRAQS